MIELVLLTYAFGDPDATRGACQDRLMYLQPGPQSVVLVPSGLCRQLVMSRVPADYVITVLGGVGGPGCGPGLISARTLEGWWEMYGPL